MLEDERPARINAETARLDQHGIHWRLEQGGRTLSVPRLDVERAREIVAPTSRARRGRLEPDPVTEALESDLARFVTSILGPDRASVRVAVRVNEDRVTEKRRRFGGRGTALRSRALRERFTHEAERQRLTDWAAQRTDTGWAVDQQESHRRLAVGRIERLSVTLVVDRRVKVGDARRMRAAVATAAGVDRARGDRVTLARLSFRSGPTRERGLAAGVLSAAGLPDLLETTRWLLLALGVAWFGYVLRRNFARSA